MDLVRIVRNEVFTDSKIIADGTNVTHRKIKTVIRTHANDMGDFGGTFCPISGRKYRRKAGRIL